MIQITDKSQCSGCSACEATCPKNCIELKPDTEGFYYPIVDMSVCVDCHLCEKTCPVLNPKFQNDELRKYYGVINKDDAVKSKSSSGGVFTLLATRVIKNGGVVFGAAMSEDCYSVEHIKIDKIENIKHLRTSKYVQSKMGDSFREAKTCLDSGTCVLFTGTPCQISGLKDYLKSDYPNLITQDIVCHGTPSPEVWKTYIHNKEDEYHSKAKAVNFRYKVSGAKTYSLRIEFENGKVYCADKNTDLYLRGYLSNLFLKPACYNCHFKGVERVADITLADFWGVGNYAPELNKGFGVSLVTVHSQKGLDLFDKVKNAALYVEVDDTPLLANSCSIKSTHEPEDRDEFWSDYEKEGVKVFARYFTLSIKERLKQAIKKILGR